MEVALSTIENSSPDSTEHLSLDGLGLKDIEPLIGPMSKFKRLLSLSLKNNEISQLSPNLGRLQSLEYLDLRGNHGLTPGSVLPGLTALTNLRHLFVDMREQDEDDLVVTLTGLVSFNGTNLGDISEDMSKIPDAPPPVVVGDQKSADRPPSVGGTVTPQQQQMGGVASQEAAANGSTFTAPRQQSIPASQDLSTLIALYDAISALQPSSGRRDFNGLVANVMAGINSQLPGLEDPLARQALVVQGKQQLTDVCFEELVSVSSKYDVQLSKVVRTAQQAYSRVAEEAVRLVIDASTAYTEKIRVMKESLERSEKETTQLLEAAELLEHESKAQEEEKQSLHETFEKEKHALTEEIGWLRTENEKLMHRVRQLEARQFQYQPGNAGPTQQQSAPSRQFAPLASSRQPPSFAGAPQPASAAVNTSSSSIYSEANGILNKSRGAEDSSAGIKTLSLRQLKDVVEEIYTSKTKFDQKCAESRAPRETMEQHLYTYLNQKYGLKSLILEQAQAIIQAVKRYATEDNDVLVFGKILRNEVDEEFRFVQKQLKETVAQLLRVYLQGKYPLKVDDDITNMLQKKMTGFIGEEEWVDIIRYMYNQEDSINIIVRVKEAIRAQSELGSRDSSPTDEQPTPRGSTSVSRRSSLGATKQQSMQQNAGKITYKEFLKILLDFQLRGHERFLSKFTRMFKAVDADRDGILNDDEFRNLLLGIDASKTHEEVAELVSVIDPFGNNHITFSEAVTFLSSDLIRLMQQAQASGSQEEYTS